MPERKSFKLKIENCGRRCAAAIYQEDSYIK